MNSRILPISALLLGIITITGTITVQTNTKVPAVYQEISQEYINVVPTVQLAENFDETQEIIEKPFFSSAKKLSSYSIN